jgi:hypothetical protein
MACLDKAGMWLRTFAESDGTAWLRFLKNLMKPLGEDEVLHSMLDILVQEHELELKRSQLLLELERYGEGLLPSFL